QRRLEPSRDEHERRLVVPRAGQSSFVQRGSASPDITCNPREWLDKSFSGNNYTTGTHLKYVFMNGKEQLGVKPYNKHSIIFITT
ncbi:hypothetical protein BaRGS_00001995, partial [Batillaria attramentaria]